MLRFICPQKCLTGKLWRYTVKRIATYYDEKSSEISSLANLRISIEIYEWIDPSLSCGLNFHALIH